MALRDNESALYKFEVSNATKLELIEAGSLLKLMSNTGDADIKGSARGLTPNQFRTGESNEFTASLKASNGNGSVDKVLTLSFTTVRQLKLELPAGQSVTADNGTGSKGPQWLPQFSSPASFSSWPISPISPWPPPFASCPAGCNKCLKPGEAASLGSFQRCTDQPCYYSPDKQQNWYCYKPGEGWCCNNGEYSPASKDQCGKTGGAWYSTEAEVIKACQPATGWFCNGGIVYQGTAAQAAKAGAILYATREEAAKTCQQPGYCCVNNRLISANQTTCTNEGGTFYTDANQAAQGCQQPGYCCVNNRLISATQTTCKNEGGAFYTDPNQAAQACQQPGYCCVNNRLISATQATCRNEGGAFYTDANQAAQNCQQQGYCCVNGSLSTATATACRYAGGTFYTDQNQARACYISQTCWCCANRKAYQTTQSSCINAGGKCYASQSQAASACTYRLQTDTLQPITPVRPPVIK